MKKNLLFTLCLLLLGITQLYAQTRTITGMVTTKDDGLPLPGVSVRVQGNQTGTQTGYDGKYSIQVDNNGYLIFSFIGYNSQTIAVNGKTAINIVLVNNPNQLNEVVVTGVGVATEKRRVAIDVATVNAKDFAKSANLSIDQALVGQIAGAQVIQSSGKPGAGAQIILRGYTNLLSSDPLIIIDGVQVGTDALDVMDPSIVDHVEVVKGSAGGMLYGSAGGNGVIQIFTKKGARDGKMVIDFSSKFSSDKVLQKNSLQAKYHHYETDASGKILDADGNPIFRDSHGIWTTPQEEAYSTDPSVQNNKPFNLPVFDHTAQAYRVANTFTNSLNIRGGSEKTDYSFGLSNLAQQDVYSSNYNRTNLNLNVGFTLAKGLTLRNSTQFIYVHENLLNSGRFNLVNSYPYIDFKYIDPSTGLYVVKPSDNIDGNNALSERDYHSRYGNTARLLQNIGLNYKFPKFLELDVKYSLDYSILDDYDYYKNQSNSYQDVSWGPPNGQITDSHTNSKNEYGIASAYFRTDFKNDFNSNLPIKTTTQVSYDFRNQTGRYYFAQGTGLPFPPANINSAATKTSGDGSDVRTLTYGFLVNQTIDYGNLFGISGGFRSDFSSVFGGQSSSFTYPRGTIYFNPSELFTNHNVIANWKVRAAYGEAGVMPNAYDRQLILDLLPIGPTGTSLSNQDTLRNAALKVQVTKELEIGTDITLRPFNNNWFSQVNFSASYWKRTSNDDIQKAPISASAGYIALLNNLVSLKSNGIDLSLDANAYKSQNFTWDLGLRFATSKTTITKLSNGKPIYSGVFSLSEGQELGVLYGQTPLHSVDQLKPDGSRYIPQANVGNYTMVNGNVVDVNTYRVMLTAANDQSFMGNTNPKFTSSIINRFTINQKLSVSFQFDWIHGNKIYNQTRQWLYRDRVSSDFDKPVTIAGKTGSFVNYYDSYYNALSPDSWFVEDGSFVRLRDASISYDLTSVVKQKWLRTLVVTVSGRNLLTFTKYSGLDPENTTSVDSQGTALGSIGSYRGVDYYGQPNVRSYQFSLNVGF